MAILSRPKLNPQQRLDLEDWNALLSSLRTDSKLWTKQFLSDENLIFKGFAVSGVGLNQATVTMANATLILPQNDFDFSYFISAPVEPDIIVSDADLTDNARNYLEIELSTLDGVPLTKAFWDPEANSGAGAEFNQTVNTITDLQINIIASTGGFSGDVNRIPLAIVDTDGSGQIKVILDRRRIFGRLAEPNDLDNDYAWGTKQEPLYSLVMMGVAGTFEDGEEIAIGGETATVVNGGTSTITFNQPTGINYSNGDAVVGTSSGATGTVDTVVESFAGVDKSLGDIHKIVQALQTEIKAIKNTRFWWQDASSSLNGLMQNFDSILVQDALDASWAWDGSELSITDASGTPANADGLALLRRFGESTDLSLTRQDGQGGSVAIPIADEEVLFIKLPDIGVARIFSGIGSADTNFQTASIDSYNSSDSNYWLAYRQGSMLYVRGYGEMETGESTPITDPDKETILAQIQSIQESANQDRQLKLIEGGVWSYAISGGSPGGPVLVEDNIVAHDGGFYSMETASKLFAQSFTPSSNVDVTDITINLRKSGNPDWYVRASIVADNGGGQPDMLTVLATTSGGSGGSDVPMATLPTDFTTQVAFTFDALASLVSGTKYWLVLSPFIGDGVLLNVGNQVQTWYNTADNLAGETSSLSSNNGGVWTNNIASADLNFEIFATSAPVPGTNNLSLSANAYIQVPGLTNGRNTIAAQTISLPNADSVAYVDINREPGVNDTLPIIVADIDSIIDDNDRVIVARRVSNGVIVGSSSFLLKEGEYLELDGANAEIHRLLDQFKIIRHDDNDKSRILSSQITQLDDTVLNQIIGSFLLDFEGAVVDYTTGEIFESDGTTSLGIDFTPQSIPVGEYFWYGLSLNPDAVDGLNRQSVTVNVDLAASSSAVAASAPYPIISGTIKLGWVQVVNNAGNIEVNQIRRLGPGAGAGGSGNGFIKVDYYNPISTSLPVGAMVTLDGQAGVDGDLVLFSNLASNNNRVYELSGVGSAIVWTPVRAFDNQFDPTDGDVVIVKKGDAFSEQTPKFDGTKFLVNDVIRLFDDVSGNFWELGSIKTTNLINNTSNNVFSVTAAGSENIIVNYSLARGTNKETGQIFITTNGTDINISRQTAFIGALGIEFSGQINAGDLELNYTADNQGVDAVMKFYLHRWSNSAGGPTGVPSYSSGGGGDTAAAGVLGDVQYHGASGNLDADARFKWDSAKGSLNLDGLEISALKGPLNIADNIGSPTTLFTYPVSSYNFAVIEYSIGRGTNYRVGRILIANSNTTPAFSDDSVEVGSTGVTFTVTVNGGNVELNYLSTATGQTGQFKYSIRQWG